MWTTVWKIVKLYPHTPNAYISGFVSDEGAALIYRVGVPTLPTFGKIFAFDTQDAAAIYSIENGQSGIESLMNTIVFEAAATGVYVPEYEYVMYCNTPAKTMSLYWRDRDQLFAPNRVPTGTVLCESLTLIRRVDVTDYVTGAPC